MAVMFLTRLAERLGTAIGVMVMIGIALVIVLIVAGCEQKPSMPTLAQVEQRHNAIEMQLDENERKLTELLTRLKSGK